MKDITTILSELRRPFPGSVVDWKVQSTNKDETSALVVAFVDARDVAERLNTVCPGQWSNRHRELIVGDTLQGVTCTISLKDETNGVTVEDVGIGPMLFDGMKDYQRDIFIKTYWSDAFKRAGVKLGIASSLYDLPQIWLKGEDVYKPGDTIKGLTKEGKASLKTRYESWVESDAIKTRFGEIYG